MPSARLVVFCTPEEFEGWLDEIQHARDTAMLVFTASEELGRVVRAGDRIPSLASVTRIFIMPATAAPAAGMPLEDVRARERGWVDVRPPVREVIGGQEMLLMAQIHGEDASSGTRFASSLVQWLKRCLAGSLHTPVEGVNLINGRSHTYHDIRFSDGAAALLDDGVQWRQFPKGNAAFRPGRETEA